MAPRITILCLLLVSTTLRNHVTSFSVRRRHSRSTDLADALRMLERQRRRIDGEDSLLAAAPQLLGDGRLTMADLESWYNSAQSAPTMEDELNAEWLAKTLGLDGYDDMEDLPEEPISPPLPSSPRQVQPSDQELDAIFGEKSGESDSDEPGARKKKDKEVMTDVKGDVKAETVQTRQSDDVIEAKTSGGSDDVRLTKEEFKALLKAVEKLQKQAIDEAEKDEEEAKEVAAEVAQKVAEARDKAKEAAADGEQQEEEAEEEEAVEEEKKKKDVGDLTPKPQPVSKEELDNLFEDQSEEVIPMDNGEIVKTDKVLKDSEGNPVGKEETVEEVETLPDKATLNSIEDFWYLKNYLDQDADRKKRNSKRNSIPPSLTEEFSGPKVLSSPDSAEMLGAYISKINQLQTELDQARMVSYLEDVENDILTNALNQATLAQVQGHINPAELNSLQDAIRVEEALQKVKASRVESPVVSGDMVRAVVEEMGEAEAEQKRGEPWKKRDDVMQAEVPVFLTGDSDDVTEDEQDEEDEEDEANTALALRKMIAQQKVNLDSIFDNPRQPLRLEDDRTDGDLIRGPDAKGVASLFSDNADQCPAVQGFSTNCEFAGDSIDFEARALCNVHEMCYVCGQTLGVQQNQCDFIYRAASSMLCQEDEQCVLEAEVFLNAMKLKHRFVPYAQRVCKTRCTAQFLSIV